MQLKEDVMDESNFEEVDLKGMRYALKFEFPRNRFELLDDREEAAEEERASFVQSTPKQSVVDMDLRSVLVDI